MRKHLLIKILSFGILTCTSYALAAQTMILEPGRSSVCSGTLLDPGGERNYSSNEQFTATLCPQSPNTQIALDFSWADIRRDDQLCIYDGEDRQAPELTCSYRWTGARLLVQATAENTSGCLTLVWETNEANTGKGFSASISCEAICQTVRPQITQAKPSLNGDSIPTIDLCPGDFIDVSGSAIFPQNGIAYNQTLSEVTYRWNLPDGRERRSQRLRYGFDRPGGYLFELFVKDANGCTSILPQQLKVRVAAPPAIEIDQSLFDTLCAPDALALSLSASSGVIGSTPTQYFQPTTSRTDSLALPDGTGASHESTIVVSQFAEGETLTSVDQIMSICAEMEHSWLRDLSIDLISPDGRIAVLHNHPGRFGEEAFLGEPFEGDAGNQTPVPGVGYSYCWNDTDSKGDWLTYLNNNPDITTLPPGTYRSYDPLSVLIGAPLNGAWTLRIKDHWEADNGWIFTWSISFANGIPLAIDSFKTEIISAQWLRDRTQSAYSPSDIAYAPTVPGTIASFFTLTNDFGCTYDSSITTVVLPAGDSNCQGCTSTVDTLPFQMVEFGDSLVFDLSEVGLGARKYQYSGSNPFSFGSNPPASPLATTIRVSSPPIDRLGPLGEGLVNICIDIEVEDASDIVAQVISPSNQRISLIENEASGRVNLEQICFSPDASNRLSAASADVSYVSNTPWTQLGNSGTEGDWRLLVSDSRGFIDTSRLHRWSLQFEGTTNATIAAPASVTEVSDNLFVTSPDSATTYTFSYTDDQGCSRTLVFPVRVRYPCAVELQQIGFTNPSCAQEPNGEVVFSASGNQGPVEYRIGNEVNSTGKFTELTAGDYLIVAMDSVGCTDTLGFQLVAPDGISIDYSYTLSSCDPLRYDVLLNLESQVGVREERWVDDASIGSGLRQNMSPGDYTFKTIDQNGCVVYHPVRLPAINPISVTTVSQDLGCSEDGSGTVRLEISGGVEPYTVSWENGSDAIERQGLAAGSYYGEVFDSYGCSTSFAVRLTEPDPLSVEPIVEPNYCQGETEGAVAFVVTGGTGPYEVRADQGPWQEGVLLFGLSPGEHAVELRDLSRCIWSSEVFIPTLSTLTDSLAITLADEYPFGDTISLDAAEGKHGSILRTLWRYTGTGTFSCDTCVLTDFIPETSGNIRLMVEDTLGCRQEATAQLIVQDAPQIMVPTAFRPQGDNAENRRLRVHGRSGTVIERFTVFDRWGTQVFEITNTRANSRNGWDGMFNGQQAPAGVYIYEVTVRARSGAVSRIRGNTTLLR